MRGTTIIMTVFLLVTAVNAWSGTLRFQSGEERATLVELFTSQGCSSCPPADRWLNAMTENRRLWADIVPVAFHVDYWDRLGWTDPYASEPFSRRQRRYRRAGRSGSVYTPGFMVNGLEWRGWFAGEPLPADNEPSAVLSAEIAGQRLKARYGQAQRDTILNVAVLGFGIQTRVRAGENRGRTLRHDFVVLSHDRYTSNDGHWSVAFDPPPGRAVERLGIALWVTRAADLSPLQATGGWLPDSVR